MAYSMVLETNKLLLEDLYTAYCEDVSKALYSTHQAIFVDSWEFHFLPCPRLKTDAFAKPYTISAFFNTQTACLTCGKDYLKSSEWLDPFYQVIDQLEAISDAKSFDKDYLKRALLTLMALPPAFRHVPFEVRDLTLAFYKQVLQTVLAITAEVLSSQIPADVVDEPSSLYLLDATLWGTISSKSSILRGQLPPLGILFKLLSAPYSTHQALYVVEVPDSADERFLKKDMVPLPGNVSLRDADDLLPVVAAFLRDTVSLSDAVHTALAV